MQRLVLTAKMPTYEACKELANVLRVLDEYAYIAISEGRNCGGAWMLRAVFKLINVQVKFSDFQEMLSETIASAGGTSLLVAA
jgi:predicted nucleic acid-binding Zn ribbon protein